MTKYVLISQVSILHSALCTGENCIKMKELLDPVTETLDILLKKYFYFSSKQEEASEHYR